MFIISGPTRQRVGKSWFFFSFQSQPDKTIEFKSQNCTVIVGCNSIFFLLYMHYVSMCWYLQFHFKTYCNEPWNCEIVISATFSIKEISHPYAYSRPYAYCFLTIFPPVPLFQTVRLFWTLEYAARVACWRPEKVNIVLCSRV